MIDPSIGCWHKTRVTKGNFTHPSISVGALLSIYKALKGLTVVILRGPLNDGPGTDGADEGATTAPPAAAPPPPMAVIYGRYDRFMSIFNVASLTNLFRAIPW